MLTKATSLWLSNELIIFVLTISDFPVVESIKLVDGI